MCGAAVKAGTPLPLNRPAKLRRDRHLTAPTPQRATQQLFVGERTVDFGRVEKSAAEFNGPMDGSY